MTKTKHVHKLRRHKFKSGNIIYHCVLPDCTHKVAPALALGKRSICNRCEEEFIMNEYSIRLAKPHCERCHQPKVEKPKVDKVEIPNSFLDLSHSNIPEEVRDRLRHGTWEDEPEVIDDEEI